MVIEMLHQKRTQIEHDKRGEMKLSMLWGFSRGLSTFTYSYPTREENSSITPCSEMSYLLDQELNLRIWHARSIWQSLDPVQLWNHP